MAWEHLLQGQHFQEIHMLEHWADSEKKRCLQDDLMNSGLVQKGFGQAAAETAAGQGAYGLGYEEGDTVRHIKFGQGTVVSIVDAGRDYEVTVQFETYGVKKLFAQFAKLKKV